MRKNTLEHRKRGRQGVRFLFEHASRADLITGAIYEGGTAPNVGSDPIPKLMRCGNQGGFRTVGRYPEVRYAVLYTTLTDEWWPDRFDADTGTFIYYGDNKTPGRDLHETPRGGNELLRLTFDRLHLGQRSLVCPFFVFRSLGDGWSRQFLGLAAPGSPATSELDDLVAIWRTKDGQRFQNYRSTFTILEAPVIARTWLRSLSVGAGAPDEPPAWKRWVETGTY